MSVLLVRHASAGRKEAWQGPDERRPVDEIGRAQADALVGLLGDRPIRVVTSSPRDRCHQTVEPLAHVLGLRVEPRDELDVDRSDADATIGFLLGLAGDGDAVACTHREVLEAVMPRLLDQGAELGELRWEKGSTWVLEPDDERTTFVRGVNLPPPVAPAP